MHTIRLVFAMLGSENINKPLNGIKKPFKSLLNIPSTIITLEITTTVNNKTKKPSNITLQLCR